MNTLPPPVATPAPTAPLTCSRCGLADISVVTRDNGVPHHVSPMKCIAALKEALLPLTRLRAAFASGITDVLLTFDHPEFGIECTVVDKDGVDVTEVHQPDGVTAILAAYYGELLGESISGRAA